MWLSYECILRYLRATRHNPSECIKRLEATLKWRRDFGLYSLITPEHVEPEVVTGKIFLYGYDTHGRPMIYCCPSKQNTEETPRQIHISFWMFERAIELMGPGVESIGLMVNYAHKTQNSSFSLSRQLLHIFQTHYPERLGVAIVGHLPWLLQAFWRLITPLMDRVTYSKLVFSPVSDDAGLWRSAAARDKGEEDAMLFASDQLLSEGWSGSVPFEYVHEVYWPALLAMCENRRKELTRVWRQLGGMVGIKEWDVKVGVQDSLTVPAAVNGNTQTSM